MQGHAMGWIIFHVLLVIMLALDLGVFHRKSHAIGVREALLWSLMWIALALLFNVGIYYSDGKEAALNFLAGYIVEKSLSVDNLFVFVLIFTYFKVPDIYQHKVLFWGIVGALVLRAAFIFSGTALLERFHWLVYVLGAMLVFSGIKLLWTKEKDIDPEKNPVLRLIRRFFPVTPDYVAGNLFARHDGRWMLTPLFLVLVFVEITDVIFAIDSIPAILGITKDAYIVYTSNVMAILGLRSLYFALAGVMHLFHYLTYGLCAILVFIGLKMLTESYIHIPVLVSLAVVGAFLTLSIVASIARAMLYPAEGDPIKETADKESAPR